METYSPVPEDAEKEPREARIARLKQEGEDENEKQLHAPTSIALTVSLVALVASRSVDQVLFYRLNYAFAFYVFYLGAVILPVAFLVITVPIVWFKLAFTNDITPAMTSFPKYKFALMGLLDTLFNLLSTFPVAKLGGSLTNVLSQAVLPINMVFAYIFLRTRFGNNHYLGAFLVIYGIMIKLMPQLFGSSDSSGGSNDDGAGTVFYTFLLIFSQAFSAASNVYKETALKGANIDEWYMNVWVSVFQLGWGILCFWQGYLGVFTAPMPAIGSCEGCSWSAMVSGANTCFLGGVVTLDGVDPSSCKKYGGLNVTINTTSCTVDCGAVDNPIYVFSVFIIFNITYNMLMLYVFKHGSSVLFVIANAVRLPLVDVLLMSGFIAGKSASSFTEYDGYALVALVLAIVVYYAEKERTERDEGTPATEGQHDEYATTIDSPYLGGNLAAQPARMSFNDVPGRTLIESRSRSGSSWLLSGMERGGGGADYGTTTARYPPPPFGRRSRSHEPRVRRVRYSFG